MRSPQVSYQRPHTLRLLNTMMATALLKVPMLLGFAHCAYYAMTPPTLPPPEKEKRVPPPPVQPWVMLVHTVLGRTEKV